MAGKITHVFLIKFNNNEFIQSQRSLKEYREYITATGVTVVMPVCVRITTVDVLK